jgi:hypothetical protein
LPWEKVESVSVKGCLKNIKARYTVSIPHPFYLSATPRCCGLKYLAKIRDISISVDISSEKTCDIQF